MKIYEKQDKLLSNATRKLPTSYKPICEGLDPIKGKYPPCKGIKKFDLFEKNTTYKNENKESL